MRAADLYSGVGGWSLGLSLAGIDVVRSYERWQSANRTNIANNGHDVACVDIRSLNPSELPGELELIVGSPPCTQFSFSNRGGQGDLKDGLRDIAKFLEVVDYCRPKFWVMENVPRVARILDKELGPRGSLRKFRHLNIETRILDMQEYGIPQKRQRCFAGNIPFELLETYKGKYSAITLGDIVARLSDEPARDPIYGYTVDVLHDHLLEPALNVEERRINRAAKVFHPVYNSMSFPDLLDKPARTITATCTRVSRESIVISADGLEFRRLSLRERACAQSFPIDFQFYGHSYGQKLRMIGNAVPPLISMLIGHACIGTPADALPQLSKSITYFKPPADGPARTSPEQPGRRYPVDRTFRFAIPSLRLKSGVRFELANQFRRGVAVWEVAFVYGVPSDIRAQTLDANVRNILTKFDITRQVQRQLGEVAAFVGAADLKRMQDVWSHRGPGATRPFDLLDALDSSAMHVHERVVLIPSAEAESAVKAVLTSEGGSFDSLPGSSKLLRNAHLVLTGLLVGATANLVLQPEKPMASTKRMKYSSL